MTSADHSDDTDGGLQSPLAPSHRAAGARFTDFNGWEMPVSFEGIRAEHETVRTAAGKFDVSHMSQVEVSGPGAAGLLQLLTTNDVAALAPGDAQYTCICREDGVILDDTLVYRLPADESRDGPWNEPRNGLRNESRSEATYLVVPNAGNNGAMTERFERFAAEYDLDATVTDRTTDLAMMAVQGPDAVRLVADEATDEVAALEPFTVRWTRVAGVRCLVARTGYTGEDGFEVVAPAKDADAVWQDLDCQPCGLGARDTLRLEAGLLLSGQEFHPDEEPRTPIEAGLSFVVDLDTEFVGRDALAAQVEGGTAMRLVGFELVERGVPRAGYDVLADRERAGHVTSGTMSPTLDRPIGFAYVASEYADVGSHIAVEVRGEAVPAKVVSRRFLAGLQ